MAKKLSFLCHIFCKGIWQGDLDRSWQANRSNIQLRFTKILITMVVELQVIFATSQPATSVEFSGREISRIGISDYNIKNHPIYMPGPVV